MPRLHERAATKAQSLAAKFKSGHPRTAPMLGEVLTAWTFLLEFAREMGAIDVAELGQHLHETEEALHQAAVRHGEQLAVADPVDLYCTRLSDALASGAAHVATRGGKCPESPEAPGGPQAYGWRQELPGGVWKPQGRRIGFIDGARILLIPETCY